MWKLLISWGLQANTVCSPKTSNLQLLLESRREHKLVPSTKMRKYLQNQVGASAGFNHFDSKSEGWGGMCLLVPWRGK